MEINRELLEGIGVITPPRSYPHQQPRNRCVGTALDSNGSPVFTDRGGRTVKVTRDGVTTFESAASFRKPRNSRARSTKRTRTIDYNAVRHMTSADLPAVQDYEADV